MIGELFLNNIFEFESRVYYCDTDAGGVVYHSRYLDFCEKARTELLRSRGIIQMELLEKHNIGFVVNYCNLCYRKPARLDDLLLISTEVKEMTGASFKMTQKVFLKESNDLLVEVEVGIVCVNDKFKLTRIPNHIRETLA